MEDGSVRIIDLIPAKKKHVVYYERMIRYVSKRNETRSLQKGSVSIFFFFLLCAEKVAHTHTQNCGIINAVPVYKWWTRPFFWAIPTRRATNFKSEILKDQNRQSRRAAFMLIRNIFRWNFAIVPLYTSIIIIIFFLRVPYFVKK